MIIYFPVSALMALFANILNNPLDPRAKSDTRLMNLVVTFLSMLGQEAEQGGVHRMLGVCAEFERIAKSVIEKAEKDQSSRRKRKNTDMAKAAAASSASSNTLRPDTKMTNANGSSPHSSRPTTATTATPGQSHFGKSSDPNHLSPHQTTDPSLTYSPMSGSMNGSPSAASTGGFQQQEYRMPQNGDFDSFSADGPAFGESPPIGMGAPFQQPLLPQDLFSLPMTLDWNWAELSGGAYPTVENGNFGEVIPTQDDQRKQQQQ